MGPLPVDPNIDGPSLYIPVMCIKCEYSWVALCYPGTILFQCPACGEEKGWALGEG